MDPAQTQTPRMRALQNLSNQLPVANQQVAAGQQAARQMQLQNAVAAAPVTGNTTTNAQQTGASAAQQAGGQAVEAATNAVKQQGQIAQTGLAEEARQGQSEVAGQEMGAKQQAMDNTQRLAAIDMRAKQELYDKQMQFQKDELGRTQFNETQLADYARTNAVSNEQLKNYAQSANQLSQRKIQAMEIAYKKVAEDLEQKEALAIQKGDEQARSDIEKQRMDINAQMSREKARAANRAAIWQTGGTIAGGVVGAFAGPAGASAGAGVGGAVGGAAGALGG